MICLTAGPPHRFNAFQRVMYQWSQLHPYNAVHVYQLAGPMDPERLRVAIADANWLNRLGIVEVSPDGQSYHHEFDSATEVRVLAAEGDFLTGLASHCTEELNGPFERPRCRPVRFSLLDAGPDAHFLAATYDHWVADSVSARLILRHVLGRYLRLDIPGNDRPLETVPGTYRDAFAGRLGVGQVAMAAARSAWQWTKNRSVLQTPCWCTSHMAVNFELCRTDPDTVPRLRSFARSLGATVHDVLLAALARAMAEFLPRRRGRGRGRDVALGTIVDTRGDAAEDLSESLGTFLAYYLVRTQPGASRSLAAVASRVAESTRPIKAGRRYFDSLVNMKVISNLWPRLSEKARPNFMRKAMPMTAGITNVHLRDTWIDRHAQGRVLDYFRGASTGPMLPLVLSPTTLADRMNLGITYRVTSFSRQTIDGIREMLIDQLENPQAAKRPRRTPSVRAA